MAKGRKKDKVYDSWDSHPRVPDLMRQFDLQPCRGRPAKSTLALHQPTKLSGCGVGVVAWGQVLKETERSKFGGRRHT